MIFSVELVLAHLSGRELLAWYIFWALKVVKTKIKRHGYYVTAITGEDSKIFCILLVADPCRAGTMWFRERAVLIVK